MGVPAHQLVSGILLSFSPHPHPNQGEKTCCSFLTARLCCPSPYQPHLFRFLCVELDEHHHPSITSYLNPSQQHRLSAGAHLPPWRFYYLHEWADQLISPRASSLSFFPLFRHLFRMLLALPRIRNQWLAGSNEGWTGSLLTQTPPKLVLCNS